MKKKREGKSYTVWFTYGIVSLMRMKLDAKYEDGQNPDHHSIPP
jgi:hypothetical protein